MHLEFITQYILAFDNDKILQLKAIYILKSFKIRTFETKQNNNYVYFFIIKKFLHIFMWNIKNIGK